MANTLTLAQLNAKIIRVRARWRYAQTRAEKAKTEATKIKYSRLAASRLKLLKELKKDAETLKKTAKQPVSKFHVGTKGLDLIKSFEGFVPTTKDDGFGNPTVGYGHVVSYRNESAASKAAKKAAFEKKYGKTLTKADATKLLSKDLVGYENSVKKHVKVGITQNMFDALTSFTYNLGEGSLAGSTLLKELNKGHYHAAAQEFLKWDMANGSHVLGLTRRREAERKLFLS